MKKMIMMLTKGMLCIGALTGHAQILSLSGTDLANLFYNNLEEDYANTPSSGIRYEEESYLLQNVSNDSLLTCRAQPLSPQTPAMIKTCNVQLQEFESMSRIASFLYRSLVRESSEPFSRVVVKKIGGEDHYSITDRVDGHSVECYYESLGENLPAKKTVCHFL